MTYQKRRTFSRKEDVTIEERVAAVETVTEHIQEDITDIKRAIDQGFTSLNGRINTQTESNRPHLAAWAGWAGVIVLIVGMFGSGYVRDLSRIELDSIDTQKRVTILESKVNGVQTNTNLIKYLDNVTQREIAQRYSEVTRRINNLDSLIIKGTKQ